MICHFLFLEAPLSCSKRFEDSPAGVKSKIQITTQAIMSFPVSRNLPRLLLPANTMVPGKCNSQEELSDHRS